MKHILTFTISIFLLSFTAFSQQNKEEKTDSLAAKQKYGGIRIGVDISKPIITAFEKDKKAFQVVADYRIGQNLYIAGEFGFDDHTREEDYLNFTTKGFYGTIGLNYNVYENWLDMNNEIYFGFRYGYGRFSQTLNSYTIYQIGDYFPQQTIETPQEFDNLDAHWGALVAGMKVETFKNLFLGASVSVEKLFTSKQPDNFRNLYIPGFERVYANDSGITFNYTISYVIPFHKKKK
ncbi:DUF6048 family protein [Aureivirga sp. CE67]|uniref:DUF6048 family protein n=1 Tax=Aureivirga sp. CE67 TaxID=1788983 RepID=UPI0018C936A8|nr:DUF6048 family protein [Aureivirga sp. CE67]